MKQMWADITFEMGILKNTTNIGIIKNFEDCINQNDEHIGLTTNL